MLQRLTQSRYFIDADWQHREVLLGFEHVRGAHTGKHLCDILLDTLNRCHIDKGRVMTITTDNASNNIKMMQELSTAVEKASGSLQGVVRAPCLAHVIQLALNKLIHRLRIQAKNDKVITTWAERPEDREKHTEHSDDKGVPYTLKKVRIYSLLAPLIRI